MPSGPVLQIPLPNCTGGDPPTDEDSDDDYPTIQLLQPEAHWSLHTEVSNGDEEKSCDKKVRVDKDGEFKGKSRCGLKQGLGAVIIKIIGIIILGPV